MEEITIEGMKEIIRRDFFNKKFTIGDIYYSIYSTFDKSKFGSIRNLIVKLSKQHFLNYTIEIRGKPHYDSKIKVKGAVYTLNK